MSFATSLAAIPGADLQQAAGAILRGVADVTLLIDDGGVIRRATLGERAGRGDAPAIEGTQIGAIVMPDDQAALDSLIGAAAAGGRGTAELRHRLPGPAGSPVRYTAIRRTDGAVLLVGRVVSEGPAGPGDFRALIGDHDAGRRKAVEARYASLFATAVEAVVVVSPESGVVEEANPRALALLGTSAEMLGQPLARHFDGEGASRVARHLATARDAGEFTPLRVRLAGSGKVLGLSGRVFRAFDRTQLMLQIAEPGADGAADQTSPAVALIARLMRESQNALALTDRDGSVIWTNAAFDALAGDDHGRTHGRTVADLTEFSAPALDAILGGARDRGRISLKDARLRFSEDRSAQGRLTVISMPDDSAAAFGLVFRPDDEPAAPAEPVSSPEFGGGTDGTTMKELLRDASEAIERGCIEAALKLTGGNRAAAAKALGLSRQSLYVKMRRFGLG